MRTKDQIIEHQGRLIMELAKIAQYKIQEVLTLAQEIEELPKNEEIIIHTAKNVIDIKNLSQKKIKICPMCGINPRQIFKSGKMSGYCASCAAGKPVMKEQKI